MQSTFQHQIRCSIIRPAGQPPAVPVMPPPQGFTGQAGMQVSMQPMQPVPAQFHAGFAAWAQPRQTQSLVGCFMQPAAVLIAPLVHLPMAVSAPMPMPVPMPVPVPMPFMASAGRLSVMAPLPALRTIPGNANYDRLPVGRPLHEGLDKTVLPLLVPQTGGLSGHVLVVERNPLGQATPHEVRHLADLQDIGVPVTPIQSFGSFRGHSARLMPQMVHVDLSSDGLLNSPFVTPATLHSLRHIIARLDTHDIPLEGLRLLMHPADGSLYVSAPAGDLTEMEPGAGRSCTGLRESLRHTERSLRQRFFNHRGS